MRIQGTFPWWGILVGGVLGAVLRPTVIYAFWLFGGTRVGAEVVLVVLTVSCFLGLVVGASGGGAGGSVVADYPNKPIKPFLIGALIGGGLALGLTLLTFIPLCMVNWLGGRAQLPNQFFILWWAAMVLSGAVPGWIGSVVEYAVHRKRTARLRDWEEQEGPRDGL